MSVNFVVHGPFKIPTETEVVRKKRKKSVNVSVFWKNDNISYLANCKGCYVFANASGTGFTPVYVGKTNKSFKSECFQTHKKTKLDEFLKNMGKSSLQIFFIVLEHSKDYFDEIDACESLLIRKCKRVNPDILNERKLKEPFVIEGIHESKPLGKPTKAVSKFKKCLNIK
jgi:hypothetical protein